MVIMTSTNPCYNPATFNPDNKPLLSKGDWSMVQLYLEDCKNLPLVVGHTPPKEFPYKDSVDVFKLIHAGAATFKTVTLPAANQMANTLYNLGMQADASFEAVVNIMAENPNKDVLKQLFGALHKTASDSQIAAKDIFKGTKKFVDMLDTQGQALTSLVNKYVDETGGLKTKIKNLKLSIQGEQTKINEAQTKIAQDNKVIHDTVYYSWIPLVGTIVALVEIIEHDKDIEKQLDIIKGAVSEIQKCNKELHKDQAQMAQLVYAESFNKHQVKLMNQTLPNLQKIEGAWGTIKTELSDIITNIDKAEGQALKKIQCLSEVYLTTAQKEWLQVANDAHDFMMNFYIKPVSKMPRKAA
jgi:hypothetical protein